MRYVFPQTRSSTVASVEVRPQKTVLRLFYRGSAADTERGFKFGSVLAGQQAGSDLSRKKTIELFDSSTNYRGGAANTRRASRFCLCFSILAGRQAYSVYVPGRHDQALGSLYWQSFETLTSSNAGFLGFLIGGHIDQSCDNRKGKWSNCMWRKVLSGEKEKNSIERNES